MRKLKKILLLYSFLMNFPIQNLNTIDIKNKNNKEYFSTEQKGNGEILADTIYLPKIRVKPSHCSEYAVKSAKDIFGKEYIRQNAWNLRYYNKIEKSIENSDSLYSYLSKREFSEGVIIGMYNPHSKYNRKYDFNRKRVKYSHVVLYIGLDSLQNPQFIHQWGRKKEKVGLEGLLEKGLRPVEVLDSPI
jgi:hypothetical protein